MASFFVDVMIEEHEGLPEGCSQRFRAQGAGAPVSRISWESDDGVRGAWDVFAASEDGAANVAMAYPVDDSSAGTSILIVGGDRGLRLVAREQGVTVLEPYLLVSRDALV